jgi:hypothetical protein
MLVGKWCSSLQQAQISWLPCRQLRYMNFGGAKLLPGSMARQVTTDNGQSG